MPPVSVALDMDITAIRIGKELGIPATEVEYLPHAWLSSVQVLWEWERVERERSIRKSRSKRKSS